MKRWFWRSFFRLLVLAAALAEWSVLAWVLVVVAGWSLPWPVHVLAPLLLHACNRRLLFARGIPGSNRRPFERAYAGLVFTSLFGFATLLVNALAWSAIAALLHSASLLGAPVTAADVLGPAGLTGSLALAVVSAALAHGYGAGQSRVRLVELEVALEGLGEAFDGLRIVQLSDIHLGPFLDEDDLATHVGRVAMLAPDLVCITGDITDGLAHAGRTFPALGRLRAKECVVATLGNHDFATGADDVTAALRRWTDFRVLRDEALVLERNGQRLHILGVDDAGLDWATGLREHPALPPLVAGVPAGEPVVLLSHRPDLFEQAAGFGIGLVLSGHTHGGQLALPWPAGRPASLADFITEFPRGTYNSGASTLHVNLGLGVTAQPVRVCSPREITLITLRRPPAGDQHQAPAEGRREHESPAESRREHHSPAESRRVQ